jgi:hypothetical protein
MYQRLNDSTFHQAIQSSRPILVTFTAPVRCQHCREQKPALEAMSAEYPTYVVDVEQPDTAETEATVGGRGVPFSKVYANGQLLTEHLGKLNLGQLMGLMKQGSELAAQMGTHRPSAPPPARRPAPAMAAVGGLDDLGELEGLEDYPDPDPAPARRQGHRTLKGLLAGFGRE